METTQSERQTKTNENKATYKISEIIQNVPTYAYIIGVSEGRKREEVKNWFEEIMSENFPHPKKNTVSCIATIEGPKQDEPKQTHIKTC